MAAAVIGSGWVLCSVDRLWTNLQAVGPWAGLASADLRAGWVGIITSVGIWHVRSDGGGGRDRGGGAGEGGGRGGAAGGLHRGHGGGRAPQVREQRQLTGQRGGAEHGQAGQNGSQLAGEGFSHGSPRTGVSNLRRQAAQTGPLCLIIFPPRPKQHPPAPGESLLRKPPQWIEIIL